MTAPQRQAGGALEHVWRSLMTQMGVTNMSKVRASQRTRQRLHGLMRRRG